MIPPKVAGRLICASNISYKILPDGRIDAYSPFDEGARFIHPAKGLTAGPEEIDAALVGNIAGGVVLAFRGTLPGPENDAILRILRNWIQVSEFTLEGETGLPGRVHQGFWRALDALWDQLVPAVLYALSCSETKKLYITGHSAGGALAHMAAARFKESGVIENTDISVYSFAAPRFADDAFKAAYENMGIKAIRYENRNDPAPHIPPSRELHHHFFDAMNPLPEIRYVPGYVSVGKLQFIPWEKNGQIRGDSKKLRAERLTRLEHLLLKRQFRKLSREHRIDCGSGYLSAVNPSLKCPTKKQIATTLKA